MKTLSTQRFRSGLKVCLVLRFLVNITFQYNKGTLRFTKEFTTILDPVLDGNGLLILGQEQDTFGGGFDKFQSFSGKISQFNMFQRCALIRNHVSYHSIKYSLWSPASNSIGHCRTVQHSSLIVPIDPRSSSLFSFLPSQIMNAGPSQMLRLWACTSVRPTSRVTSWPGQPRAGPSRTGPPLPLSLTRHSARSHSVTRSSSCLTPWAMTGRSSCVVSSQVI